ncbi:MAG: 30S ribosomal protein S3 [Nanoarchaeota archaeon]
MEEKKFVQLKKDEFGVKEFIKKELGKGKMSSIKIEYTPLGEKITIITNKPGYVIGRRGERIMELTDVLKKRFNFENPHIEIQEIENPECDAQYVADEIASSLERFGSSRFKVIAYKMLERVVRAGALGVELRLGGKLPGERARSWRFAHGYLKKSGDPAKIVNRAKARADTMAGTIGIKVSILPPGAKIHDQIEINPELINKIKENLEKIKNELESEKADKKKIKIRKKSGEKEKDGKEI